MGELALDGRVKPVRGALSMAVLAGRKGCRGMIIPADNAQEAAVVEPVRVFGLQTLPQVVEFLTGKAGVEPLRISPATSENIAGSTQAPSGSWSRP